MRKCASARRKGGTRLLAPAVKLPMWEPASPAEMHSMVTAAFELSEKHRTPIIIRETRAASQSIGLVPVVSASASEDAASSLGLALDAPLRFCPYPANAVEMSSLLHARLDAFRAGTPSVSSLSASICFQLTFASTLSPCRHKVTGRQV